MGSDAASGIRLWARTEVRRRLVALVLLGALAGAATGLAIAAIEGAGHTESAYARMHDQLDGADAVFFPSQVGFSDADVTKLGEMPEVAAWGGFTSTPGSIDEFPGEGGPLVMVGGDWFTTLEGARVLAGRLPDPNADDEMVINESLHTLEDIPVGAAITWRNLSPADFEAFGGEYPPEDYDWTTATGPVTRLHVVGVVRQPMESVVSFASGPTAWVGPGWAQAHLAETAVDFNNAFVRLRNGAADLPAFEADVARVYGRDDIPIKDLSDDIKRVQRSLDVERTALLLFAAAVIVATVVIIGQALARSIRAGAEDAPALRSLGLDGRDLLAGLVAPHAVTIVVAAVVASATSLVLSTRFPIGLGRRLDPELGLRVDIGLLAIAVAAIVVVALLVCTLAARRAVGRLSDRHHAAHAQLLGAVSRTGASVPVAIGASMALDPAPRAGSTARSALLVAIVGVLGVVGAITLVAGIDDALDQPERVGQVWDLQATVFAPPDAVDGVIQSATKALAKDPDIAAFARTSRIPSVVEGKGDVPLYSLTSLDGSMEFTVLKGRAPRGDGEIALGPRTSDAIGAGIGDTVDVGPSGRPMRVVGITLLVQTPHSSFDEGASMTPSELDSVTGIDAAERAGSGSFLVDVRDGASIDDAWGRVSELGFYVEQPYVPPDVTNLGNVRDLPLYLAAFLTVLAIGAIAHALLTGTRSRARDLAVLRALGLTPGQAAACVLWQAAIIGIVALAVGIPLGVIVGRRVWRLLADSLSFVYIGPLVGVAIAIVIAAALAAIAMVAAWPARGVARLRTAEVLRSE